MIAIILNAAFYLCHAALPDMLKRGKGSLVMVASISGVVGMKTAHTYCSAKGGVINMVRPSARRWRWPMAVCSWRLTKRAM